jgi:hypothetical protein
MGRLSAPKPMRPSPLLVPAILLGLLAASSRPARALGDGDGTPARESLEDFLERARREREAVQKRMQGDVDALVSQLEASTDAKMLRDLVERTVALGQEATPLLVRHLDPGEGPLDKDRVRAQQVALALARMDTSPILADLVALLEKGSNDGKRHALKVLEGCPARERAFDPVQQAFRTSEGSVKQAALQTLIAIGGPRADAVLGEVLTSGDDQLVALAIDGLADAQDDRSLEPIRRILGNAPASARHAKALLRYFEKHRPLLESSDVLAFVRVAQQSSVSLDTRIEVIDRLAELRPALDNELRKAMEPIATAHEQRLRESGLILLARLGDKSSERELVRGFDDFVAKNENWAEAYVRRADMFARIGDDDKAIKDYRQALTVGKDDPTVQAETHVKLARALVRKGKLKEAADRLRQSPVSMARLRELSEDPEFAPLRNSKWGKEAFGLD